MYAFPVYYYFSDPFTPSARPVNTGEAACAIVFLLLKTAINSISNNFQIVYPIVGFDKIFVINNEIMSAWMMV